jgi:hypothetical protein
MPINFIKPGDGTLDFTIDETKFKFKRLNSAERETISRRCYEEGRMGVRLVRSEEMYRDELIRAALIGWENFIKQGTKEKIEFSDEMKNAFVDYGDDQIKDTLAAFLKDPSRYRQIFDEIAEKKG